MGQYPVFVVMYILNLSAHYKVNTVWRFSIALFNNFARYESKQSELLCCCGKGGSWKGVGTTFVTLLSSGRNSGLSLKSWYEWFGMVHSCHIICTKACNTTLPTMMSWLKAPSSSASLSEGVNKSSSGKLVWIVWCGIYGGLYGAKVCIVQHYSVWYGTWCHINVPSVQYYSMMSSASLSEGE